MKEFQSQKRYLVLNNTSFFDILKLDFLEF